MTNFVCWVRLFLIQRQLDIYGRNIWWLQYLFLHQMCNLLKLVQVHMMSETKNRSWIWSSLFVASLVFVAYLIGGAFISKEYKDVGFINTFDFSTFNSNYSTQLSTHTNRFNMSDFYLHIVWCRGSLDGKWLMHCQRRTLLHVRLVFKGVFDYVCTN